MKMNAVETKTLMVDMIRDEQREFRNKRRKRQRIEKIVSW